MALYAACVLYASIIPLALFLGYYTTRSKWRANPIGRIIVGLLVSLLAVMLIGLVSYVFDPGWLDLVRVVVYGFMHVGMWHLFITLRSVQRTSCDGSKEPTDVVKVWRKVRRSKID